jgi:multidrug efflux pump subunit AcrB
MGPDPSVLRGIADKVETVMCENFNTRDVNQDWGERVPTMHFVLDQQRLQLIGLTPTTAAGQLQFLLTGTSVTQIREDIRTVDLVARSADPDRLDPAKLGDLTLINKQGKIIPVSQIGHIETRFEEPILRRRDRIPTINVQSDIDESLQPPEVSMQVARALKPLEAALPDGYHIEVGGNIKDSVKANDTLAPIFPIMLLLTLVVLVFQLRSISAMTMVFLTAPLGLIGVVPILLIFHQPVRIQCDPGSARPVRYTYAQHADSDRPDPHQPSRRSRKLSRRRRSDGPACPPRPADGVGRGTCLRSADAVVILGTLGLHADWRHRWRHGTDPGVSAGALCDLV